LRASTRYDAGVELTVDRTSPVPLYFQLAQQLEQAITSGTLPAGSRLDNEISLAERYGLSRPTVRQAIGYLVNKGLLVRRRGLGTQVLGSPVRRPIELTSLYDDLAASGQQPTTEVLSLTAVPAGTDTAAALGVPPGTEVHRLVRLRRARDEPLALMTNHVPLGLADLSSDRLEAGGLYQLLRTAGIQLRVANQTIGARAATAAESRTLHERRGAPLLTMTRVTYDDTGRAVEHGSHLYRASRYTFASTLVHG
jgi:DNA-binding GntR family transcriptional regulator